MNEPFWFIIGLIAFVLAIPCRFDPAIRLKEWMIKTGRHPESRRKS